jgi:rhodanese-related sulfurtransferase
MRNPNLPNAPETDVVSTAQALEEQTAQVVDVREADEWADGHIAGAIHIPLGDLGASVGELDPSRPVITLCAAGVRSLYAAEALIGAGFGEVASMAGGMVAWEQAGLPVERDEPGR